MYKNVLMVETLDGLSTQLYDGAVVMVNGDTSSIYVVEGGGWVKKSLGPSLELSWPVDSIMCTAEKDPRDLLGFGKWELIVKEPVFMWKRLE